MCLQLKGLDKCLIYEYSEHYTQGKADLYENIRVRVAKKQAASLLNGLEKQAVESR